MNIWVATANSHKVDEIRHILGEKFRVKSLLDLPETIQVEENGDTYAQNALIKAKTLWQQVKEPVFADDSGLEIDALNGAPGLYSSRYSGPDATDKKNIDKVLSQLSGVSEQDRGACFKCVIVYLDKDGTSHEFTGTLPGKICESPSGSEGFGYDPIFYLPERGCTVAEISAQDKNKISHRARAVASLREYLTGKN